MRESMANVGLMRNGGLGDVLMALSAAHAVKACGHQVTLFTSEPFIQLAECCPHVDSVLSKNAFSYGQMGQFDYFFDFGAAIHGVRGKHLVDVFLENMGIDAQSKHKELHLHWPKEAYEEVERFIKKQCRKGCKRILLHPGVSDPNRTWPKARWESLAERLIACGYEVIAIGKSDAWTRSASILNTKGVINAMDSLSLCEVGVLMEHSDLLVSCDSGPIQLAGATSIVILGIYTVVKAEDRFPFRRGSLGWKCHKVETASCPWWPCYRHMLDPKIWKPHEERIHLGVNTVGEVFSSWCLHEKPFSCLEELEVEVVATSCIKALN